MSSFVKFIAVMIFASNPIFSQETKALVYDTQHSQFVLSAEYKKLIPENAEIRLNNKEITDSVLQNIHGLFLLFPRNELKTSEKKAVKKLLNSGGSLLLVFDEEKRTPFNNINDIIAPFGIEITKEDTPYVHNCGAIAPKSEVCTEKREIPYSGGRSVIGGEVIGKVLMDGNYIRSAYVELDSGGKIIVMADGMAALLMGTPSGKRLTGNNPTDTNYWGKDSRVFMKEILAFFLK